MVTDVLLSPREVAHLLRVHTGTLAVWRCKKRYALPYVRIGRKVYYRESDVLRWLERRRVAQAEEATDAKE